MQLMHSPVLLGCAPGSKAVLCLPHAHHADPEALALRMERVSAWVDGDGCLECQTTRRAGRRGAPQHAQMALLVLQEKRQRRRDVHRGHKPPRDTPFDKGLPLEDALALELILQELPKLRAATWRVVHSRERCESQCEASSLGGQIESEASARTRGRGKVVLCGRAKKEDKEQAVDAEATVNPRCKE